MTVIVYACILGSTLVNTILKRIEESVFVVTLDEDLILFLILTFLSKNFFSPILTFFNKKNRRRKNGDFFAADSKSIVRNLIH